MLLKPIFYFYCPPFAQEILKIQQQQKLFYLLLLLIVVVVLFTNFFYFYYRKIYYLFKKNEREEKKNTLDSDSYIFKQTANTGIMSRIVREREK